MHLGGIYSISVLQDSGPFLYTEHFKLLYVLRMWTRFDSEQVFSLRCSVRRVYLVLLVRYVWLIILLKGSSLGQVLKSWQRQPGFGLEYPGRIYNVINLHMSP